MAYTSQLSVRLSEATRARVRAAAERRGISQAALIRQALAWWLDQEDRRDASLRKASRKRPK